jgi:hypothetical protein
MLNHPYYIYYQEILSNYQNYELYNNELIRLFEYLNNLIIKDNSLINFVIGTPMEDMNYRKKLCNKLQYSQILGKYIYDYLEFIFNKKENTDIEIIVISPDDIFKDDYELLFTKHEFIKFIKINNLKYFFEFKNTEYDFTIKINLNIFNCPMPHTEKRLNLIDKYNDLAIKLNKNINYSQNDDDLLFIKNFYQIIEKIFKLTKYLIVSSFAVFNNLEKTSPYMMFTELKDLGTKYNKILLEWIWNEDFMFSKLIAKHIKPMFVLYSDMEYTILDRYYCNKLYILKFNNDGIFFDSLL